jgi:hypothetical protein
MMSPSCAVTDPTHVDLTQALRADGEVVVRVAVEVSDAHGRGDVVVVVAYVGRERLVEPEVSDDRAVDEVRRALVALVAGGADEHVAPADRGCGSPESIQLPARSPSFSPEISTDASASGSSQYSSIESQSSSIPLHVSLAVG